MKPCKIFSQYAVTWSVLESNDDNLYGNSHYYIVMGNN